MEQLRKFAIAYKGLSVGNHDFQFEIDDRFWSAFDGSEIHKGHATVQIELEKRSNNLLTLHVNIQGVVNVDCDRCLEECTLPVDCTETLLVRFSESEDESDGEIMWLSPAEPELNVAQYLYETICLNLPYQRIHPLDENGESSCNPEMLAKFKIVSEEEFEAAVAHDQEPGESPWSKLETLKEQL